MASYNRTRYVEELLEKTESLPPSFSVHLHLEYWTLNNGSKFLYNNQIASLLDDVRAHRIPVDFLDLFEAAKVPFYDGCMIVELLDYRLHRDKEPTPDKPERTRAVLHPNSETMWADICSLNQRYGGKWSDKETLEIEARLVLATSPPLCLDPDPHLTRIANHVLRASTPTVPVSLKRKASAMNLEEDETDKARRAKIMQFMNPRQNRPYNPSYQILDIIQNARQKAAGGQPIQVNGHFVSNAAPSPSKPPTPSINVSQSPVEDDKKVNVKKAETPQTQFATTAFTRANRSQTPIPPQNTHTFISQNPANPSPAPSSHSPMQPQVYPNVQAATEAAKRTPTPAQIKQYSQSPRPPQSRTPAPLQQPPPPTSLPQSIPQPQNAFQPQVPNPHFLNPPPARHGMPKVAPSINTGKMTPQQQQANYAHHLLYAQQQQQAQHLQQRLKNGRATPQVAAGAGQSTPSPARSSPMVTNKPLAARSPMPPTTQLPAQQQHIQPQPQHQQQPQQQGIAQHPPQHPQHAFTPQYNPSQLRPLVHGNPQLPAHMTAATLQQVHQQQQTHATAPVTGASDGQQQQQPQQQQTQAQIQQQMQLYQMYGYPAMNYGQIHAHAQRMYWQQQQQQQGMGRGVPITGVQQPGMPAQQVVGKAGGAGMQGR
ncbi:SAGA complex subunit spt20 [Hypsizygus marmoreus]|uniref:SAGA complex subunit spt20 n=1 Tax=Hypsizygus marmoreus TaxID=39966 RepID=A0A369JNI6_HYPMA|nr:SAGA complex subunit spt20 [Hypsizygus marmoreus]